ncbi:hypothetical protein D3C81_1990210 [compost metagenome]
MHICKTQFCIIEQIGFLLACDSVKAEINGLTRVRLKGCTVCRQMILYFPKASRQCIPGCKAAAFGSPGWQGIHKLKICRETL